MGPKHLSDFAVISFNAEFVQKLINDDLVNDFVAGNADVCLERASCNCWKKNVQ